MTTCRATAAALFLLFLAAGSGAGPAAAQEAPRAGGILKAAMIGEPPTLDTHTTTATISYQIAWHVFETLYTYDRQFQPIPHLAESHTVSDCCGIYTISLRKGVKFHNGRDLTAADAAASMARWGRLHVTGKTLFKSIEAVEAKDATTLVVHLKEPSGSLLFALASPYLAIHPKSVLDAAGDQPVKELVGTGPDPSGSSSTSPIATSAWPASRSTRRGRSRAMATAASAPRGSTRSTSCRCRRWRCGRPGSRAATTTSPRP
jgi:peptide/nickel transport system substrate-binding protein